MLLLDSRCAFIDGVSVFPDHIDPKTWYFLPGTPRLSTRNNPVSDADDPSFLLLAYTGESGGGGFLDFDVNIGIDEDQRAAIAGRIASNEHLLDRPNLVPVPLVGGTVRLQLLGMATGEPTPVDDGHPRFVLAIDQGTNPALYNDNQASFSVQLDQAGFTVVDQCIDGAILPIAVIYQLDFLGLRPAYNVHLKIDWDRVQKHLDDSFSAKVLWFSTEINSVVDELVESRAIEFTADVLVPEDGSAVVDRAGAAIAQVRQMITDAFFTPSVPPWTPEKPSDWEKALGAIGRLATQGAALAAGGGGGGAQDNVSFSYKHTDYTRIDRKHLDVNFSERATVQRTIYPQGHLGQVLSLISASGRPRADFVKRVNIDDPWFKRRHLKVFYSPGLAAPQISSINVHADYRGQSTNAFLTAPQWTAEFDWANILENGAVVRDVQVSYEVNLTDVDTTERPASFSSTPQACTEPEELLVPERDLFAVRPINVRTEGIAWTDYSSILLELRYVDVDNAINQTDQFRFVETTQDSTWLMFVVDRSKTTFQQRITYFAIGQPDVTTDWSDVTEESVTVRDPFAASRRTIAITPPHVWTDLAAAFVDVRYDDEDTDVHEAKSFTFQDGAAPESFEFTPRDPNQVTVHYTVTFQYTDGRTVVLPDSMTDDIRITVSPDMKGRRIVTVHRPADFTQRKMRSATVELRFEDPLGGISVADTIVLDASTETGRFEYPIADGTRDRYQYRSKIILQNGMSRTTDWTDSDALDLQLTVA
ncbi:hypothetical protein [Nakamurella lactea]|uniref:hypothetical protein n=1 Tax=Nakamurella lactea TaxID=459515 RepID=UPI0003FE78E2|nr:hypothetical protein [Nakamurella lactea]